MAEKSVGFCFVFLLLIASMAMAIVPSVVGGRSNGVGGTAAAGPRPNYADALSKCLLFYEGQRSGKLPSTQRLTWRKDSALTDGQDASVDLVGGYYDAGDNVKFGFPMAFTATMLAWSIIEFSVEMGHEVSHAHEALRWTTDYLLKATSQPNKIFVQVGNPNSDHNCWQRPEDMDTPRNVYAVDTTHPGSEVAGETAAALAAASIVFRKSRPDYANTLLTRAKEVYDFAYKYQGSYRDSIGQYVCPFYCDFNGYQDELVWGAAWLNKATNSLQYLNNIVRGIQQLGLQDDGFVDVEFGWDNKHAGIFILLLEMQQNVSEYSKLAEDFACSLLPESPTKTVKFTPGGLLFKTEGCNLQDVTALSFLLLVYARFLNNVKGTVTCGNLQVPPSRLIDFARTQVDYILGNNPLGMSYMVGYGAKFPQKIHHRASSLPSMDQHPQHIACKDGTPYFESSSPNPNLLIGAVVGGPNDGSDNFADSRYLPSQSEPTTYVNAPLAGALAYFSKYG